MQPLAYVQLWRGCAGFTGLNRELRKQHIFKAIYRVSLLTEAVRSATRVNLAFLNRPNMMFSLEFLWLAGKKIL